MTITAGDKVDCTTHKLVATKSFYILMHPYIQRIILAKQYMHGYNLKYEK